MDKKQRKKLARAQSRQIIVGMLKNFSIKNCWHLMKEHWKEFLVAGGATLGAATFAGCVPKDNPPAIVQPSGDIESGDINSSDINSGEEKPDIPSGDIGSGDIGSGEEKPEPPSGETPDSGEENPGEEIKYPSTIAEMTDEQKKILTDYLDQKYKDDIAKSVGIDATADNTSTIGYTIENNHVEALFETTNGNNKYVFAIETEANVDIYKFFEALDKNADPSEYAKLTFVGYTISPVFTLPQIENEYSANAENAYKFSNQLVENPLSILNDPRFYAIGRGNAPAFGTMCPRVRLLCISSNSNSIQFSDRTIVVKSLTDYNNINLSSNIEILITEENTMKFGSKYTIFIAIEPQLIKE